MSKKNKQAKAQRFRQIRQQKELANTPSPTIRADSQHPNMKLAMAIDPTQTKWCWHKDVVKDGFVMMPVNFSDHMVGKKLNAWLHDQPRFHQPVLEYEPGVYEDQEGGDTPFSEFQRRLNVQLMRQVVNGKEWALGVYTLGLCYTTVVADHNRSGQALKQLVRIIGAPNPMLNAFMEAFTQPPAIPHPHELAAQAAQENQETQAAEVVA